MKTARLGVLLLIGFLSIGARGLRAEDGLSSGDLKQYEGPYQLTGANCEFAPGLEFTEDSDLPGGETCYHLKAFGRDGRIWSSREFRQLNGPPWYKADAGNDGTVLGRSRYSCRGAGCKLWNEHKNCSGGIVPLCSRWQSTPQDSVIFSYSTIALYDTNGGLCSYRRIR